MSCVRDGGCARVGGVRREEVGGPHFGRGEIDVASFPPPTSPTDRARVDPKSAPGGTRAYTGGALRPRGARTHTVERAKVPSRTMMVQPPSFETLVLEVDRAAHVGVVRLNRPRKSNAIDASMWDEIPRAMRWMDEDEDVASSCSARRGRTSAPASTSPRRNRSPASSASRRHEGDCPGRKAEALYRCARARALLTSRIRRARGPFNNDPSRPPPPFSPHTHVPLPTSPPRVQAHTSSAGELHRHRTVPHTRPVRRPGRVLRRRRRHGCGVRRPRVFFGRLLLRQGGRPRHRRRHRHPPAPTEDRRARGRHGNGAHARVVGAEEARRIGLVSEVAPRPQRWRRERRRWLPSSPPNRPSRRRAPRRSCCTPGTTPSGRDWNTSRR